MTTPRQGPVPGVDLADRATPTGDPAPSHPYTGLSLASMIDPCVQYVPIRDEAGRIVDFRYVELNDAAVTYNGFSREDTIGHSLLELFPGHLATGWFDRYVEVVETGQPLELNDVSYPLERSGRQLRQYEIRALATDGGFVLTWRDVTTRFAAQQALAESEERFRLLAENATDVVLEIDSDGVIKWASPAATAVIGRTPDELCGTALGDLADDGTCRRFLEDVQTAIASGEVAGEYRLRTADGDLRWMEVRMHSKPAAGVREAGLVVGLRDIHREVLARHAGDTLSAANAAIVRSRTEVDLLAAMCEVPLSAGGYRLALYARRAADGTAAVVACHSVVPGIVEVGSDPIPLPAQVPTDFAIRSQQLTILRDLQNESFDEAFRDRARRGEAHSCASLPVFVDGVLDGAFTVYAGEPDAFDGEAIRVLTDVASQVGVGLARLRTASLLAKTLENNSLLLTAVDQAAESIVVTDTTPAIVYANPATVTTTGYSLDEIIGQNPRMFQSGLHDRTFYEDMWAQLVEGIAFHGQMVNRRKSGEVYEEDASITPVHDESGRIIAYVGVKHDLTPQHRAEEALSRHRADRQMALDVMRDVHPAETLEGTANALAAAVGRLPGFDGVIVMMLSPDGEFIPVGATPSEVEGFEIPLGRPVPLVAAEDFIEATRRGPWWLELADMNGPAGLFPDISAPMAMAGFVIAAYAPIRWEGELVGALAITSRSPDGPQWIDDRLPALEELGTFAGMLFGARAQIYGDVHVLRSRIREVIDAQQFHIVMQPVIDLRTGAIVGYEALSRFDDGAHPHQRFSQAHGVGLGSELEGACALQALRDAAHLPQGPWLSLNFSPASVVDGTAERTIAAADGRPVVVEITEHLAIDSYPNLRGAISQITRARLAVDDAGAGFASLRHILELRPDYVKLDLELVRDIDTDPARQALAAGLRHFCSQSGMTLIAEGVETEAEAAMLLALGVDLAQGYFYGRPAPVSDLGSSAG